MNRTPLSAQDMALSISIENLLVQRNPRQMQTLQAALEPGYLARGASHLRGASGIVIIGTGFPVTGTFETDGPAGAIALYNALASLGATPMIACGPPLAHSLAADFTVLELTEAEVLAASDFARTTLAELKPDAVVAIERPGLAVDGRYYNMRGDDISERCYCFDPFVTEASCPTVAVGDGGNEIGMGNVLSALTALDIQPSVTPCDELLVTDVSNWGAYALVAMLGYWVGRDLLAELSLLDVLNYLSRSGSVDGVTGVNTLTEDGMAVNAGLEVIAALRRLTKFLEA